MALDMTVTNMQQEIAQFDGSGTEADGKYSRLF